MDELLPWYGDPQGAGKWVWVVDSQVCVCLGRSCQEFVSQINYMLGKAGKTGGHPHPHPHHHPRPQDGHLRSVGVSAVFLMSDHMIDGAWCPHRGWPCRL
jgi:hypothetical protein